MARSNQARNAELELAEVLADIDRKGGVSIDRPGCPSATELRRFVSGKCAQAQVDSLLTHLGSCQHCMQVLKKVHARRLLSKRAYVAMAAAAAILIAVWIAVGRLSSPPAGLATIDLRPISPTRGTENAVRSTPKIDRRSGTLRVILPIGSEGKYQCEIRLDRRSTAIARSSGVTVLEGGNVVLDFPVNLRSLPPGHYSLALRRDGSEWVYYPMDWK